MARQVAAAIWFTLLVSGCAGGSPAPSARPKVSSPRYLLDATPTSVDWGRVPAGGVREAEITLHNPCQTPVKLVRLETSCDCLHVELPGSLLGPGESAVLRMRIDLCREKKAAGDLRLEVTGYAEQGVVAFRLRAAVTVTAPG